MVSYDLRSFFPNSHFVTSPIFEQAGIRSWQTSDVPPGLPRGEAKPPAIGLPQ
jgi:hypothetical protein